MKRLPLTQPPPLTRRTDRVSVAAMTSKPVLHGDNGATLKAMAVLAKTATARAAVRYELEAPCITKNGSGACLVCKRCSGVGPPLPRRTFCRSEMVLAGCVDVAEQTGHEVYEGPRARDAVHGTSAPVRNSFRFAQSSKRTTQ